MTHIHMPRKHFVCDHTVPYHVYNRCINKDWFNQPLDEVWNIFTTYLWFIGVAFDVRIHAFVLMSNHFHLLISAPNGNLSEAMRYFLSMTSRELVKTSDRINHTYAHRFGRSRLGTYQYYLNAYKYIFYNPIDAGIVTQTQQYPYSSLGVNFHKINFGVPISDDIFYSDPVATLAWINKAPNKEQCELVKNALAKREEDARRFGGICEGLMFV